MSDLISRQTAIDVLEDQLNYLQMLNKDENPAAESKWYGVNWARNTIADLPSAQPEITRCKDCIYGHLYVDVQNGITDSWIECRNPEGLFRDTAVDEYCSASIKKLRKKEAEEVKK